MANDLKPTHGVLRQQVLDASLVLIDQSPHGEVSGEDVANYVGINPSDPQLYHVFKAVDEQGYLRCDFSGGMKLPWAIRRP